MFNFRKTRAVQLTAILVSIGAIFGSPSFASQTVPSRVVSINLCTDELLLRIADPENIRAVTRYPKTPLSESVVEKTPSIQTIRGFAEEVIALEPDLVLAGTFTHKETVALLQKMGIAVLLVQVPQNFDAIYENIERVAKALGVRERGTALVQDMQTKLEKIHQENPAEKPLVLMMQARGYVPGLNTFEDEIIQAAGGENLAAKLGMKSFSVLSLEELVLKKPDILIFPVDSASKAALGVELLDHPAIKKALGKRPVHTLSPRLLNCGSPASVDAVEVLAQLIRQVDDSERVMHGEVAA